MHNRFFSRDELIARAPEMVDTMDVPVETGLAQLIKDIKRKSVTFMGEFFPQNRPLTRNNIKSFLVDRGFSEEEASDIILNYSQKPAYAINIGSTILQPILDADLQKTEGSDKQSQVRNAPDDYLNDIGFSDSTDHGERTISITTTAYGYGVEDQTNQRIATIGEKESQDKMVAISLLTEEGFRFSGYDLTGVFVEAMENYLSTKNQASIPTYHLFKKLANLSTNIPLQDAEEDDFNEIFALIDQIFVNSIDGEKLDIKILPEKSQLGSNMITLLGRLNELKTMVQEGNANPPLLERINALSSVAQEKYNVANKEILKLDFSSEYKKLFTQFLNTPLSGEDDNISLNILKQMRLLTSHYQSLNPEPINEQKLIGRMAEVIKDTQLATIKEVLFIDFESVDPSIKADLIVYQRRLIEVIKLSIPFTLKYEFTDKAADAAIKVITALEKEKGLLPIEKTKILFALLESVIAKDTRAFFAIQMPNTVSRDFRKCWELYKDEFNHANLERILEDNKQKLLDQEPNYIQGIVYKLSSLDLVMQPYEKAFLKKIIKKFKQGEQITAEKFLQTLFAHEKEESRHNLSKNTLDNFVELLNCMEQIDALSSTIKNLATAAGYEALSPSEVRRIIFQSSLQSFAGMDEMQLEALKSKVDFTYKFTETIFHDNFNFEAWMTILSGINDHLFSRDIKSTKLDVVLPDRYDENMSVFVYARPPVDKNISGTVSSTVRKKAEENDDSEEEDEKKSLEEIINSLDDNLSIPVAEDENERIDVIVNSLDNNDLSIPVATKNEGLRSLITGEDYQPGKEPKPAVKINNDFVDKKIESISNALSKHKYIPDSQFEMGKGQKYSDISLLQSVRALTEECARFKAQMLKCIENSLSKDLHWTYFEQPSYLDASGHVTQKPPEIIFEKILEDYKKDKSKFPKASYFYSFIENYVNVHKLHCCLKDGMNHPYETLYNFEVQFNALRDDLTKHSNTGLFIYTVTASQREDIILKAASDQYQEDLTWEIRKAVGKQEINNRRKHRDNLVYPKYGIKICWPDGVQKAEELAKLSPKARKERQEKIEPIVSKAINGMITDLKTVYAHRKNKAIKINPSQAVLAANVSDNYELKVLLEKYDALTDLKKTLNPSDPESADKFKAEFKKHEKTFKKSEDDATNKFFKILTTIMTWGLIFKETWESSSNKFSHRVGHFFSHKKKRETDEKKEHNELVKAAFPKPKNK